jgi:hypothetical protein
MRLLLPARSAVLQGDQVRLFPWPRRSRVQDVSQGAPSLRTECFRFSGFSYSNCAESFAVSRPDFCIVCRGRTPFRAGPARRRVLPRHGLRICLRSDRGAAALWSLALLAGSTVDRSPLPDTETAWQTVTRVDWNVRASAAGFASISSSRSRWMWTRKSPASGRWTGSPWKIPVDDRQEICLTNCNLPPHVAS